MSDFERTFLASNGKPFVFDDGGLRSLHFDRKIMQSAMSIAEPDELTFGYTRAMMGFLLFNSEPKHILMIGLGGGSLAKYCYSRLPSTRVTVIEIDADVIALRDQFLIPRDCDRFQVIHADAVQHVAAASQNVDVILLDGYSADGIVADLNTEDFYAECRRVLNPDGILVANFWDEDPLLPLFGDRLCREFGWHVWTCGSEDSYNTLGFAINGETQANFKRVLKKRSRQLSRRFALNLQRLAAEMELETDPSNSV